MLRIASWNINSVRIRIPLIARFVQQYQPDILCLQETKSQDENFPLTDLQLLGFPHIQFRGEKSYNGVAILSKIPLTDVDIKDFAAPHHARHIAVTLPNNIRLHNVYIPAGGDIADVNANPKFKHKLNFLDAMTSHFSNSNEQQAILLGDFNIAPLEHDVWSHKQLLKVVSHTPIEVERLNALQQSKSWIDTGRYFVPESEKLYSWWSYRSRDWLQSNRGRRLDHIWCTPDLKDAIAKTHIISEARGWEKPSDHVPVILDLHDRM